MLRTIAAVVMVAVCVIVCGGGTMQSPLLPRLPKPPNRPQQ